MHTNSIQCDVVVYYSYASLCTIISDVYPKYTCTKQFELFDYYIMFHCLYGYGITRIIGITAI